MINSLRVHATLKLYETSKSTMKLCIQNWIWNFAKSSLLLVGWLRRHRSTVGTSWKNAFLPGTSLWKFHSNYLRPDWWLSGHHHFKLRMRGFFAVSTHKPLTYLSSSRINRLWDPVMVFCQDNLDLSPRWPSKTNPPSKYLPFSSLITHHYKYKKDSVHWCPGNKGCYSYHPGMQIWTLKRAGIPNMPDNPVLLL